VRRDVRKDISGDHTFLPRYEIKYLISESQAAAIAQFIRPYVRPDRYCKLRPEGSYPVASLYLDSKDLRLCRESMTGQKNRFKLRIRSYVNDLNYPCFFEIKRRVGTPIIKTRERVMPRNVAPLILGKLPISQGDGSGYDTLKQFMLYKNSMNASPIVRTRYLREAFESIADDRVRITFDRNLCYNVTSAPEVGLDGNDWQPMHLNRVVLEIKFTGHYPAWLGQMVKYFSLRQQSTSKYVQSIKRACLLGLLLG
jgi:hypothetical protein